MRRRPAIKMVMPTKGDEVCWVGRRTLTHHGMFADVVKCQYAVAVGRGAEAWRNALKLIARKYGCADGGRNWVFVWLAFERRPLHRPPVVGRPVGPSGVLMSTMTAVA